MRRCIGYHPLHAQPRVHRTPEGDYRRSLRQERAYIALLAKRAAGSSHTGKQASQIHAARSARLADIGQIAGGS